MESDPLLQLLQRHPDISFVSFQWVDYCGHLRARMVPKEHALRLQCSGQSLSSALVHMAVLPDGTTTPDRPATAIEHFRPDWTSIRTFSYDDNESYVAVNCDILEDLPGRQKITQRCPRTVLREVSLSLHELNMLMGFELEFTILNKSGSSFETTDGYSSASVFRTKSFRIVQDCVRQLQKNGVNVLSFHAEGRGSQFEIATGPLKPLEAIDTLVQTQDIIKGVVARHDCRASMHPAPTGQISLNGLHAHVSFSPTQDEEHIIAGILNRLPALCAFSLPSEDSYRRLAPTACGTWVAWGTQNRDCPLRKISPGRWEIRCFDSTANPYLAMSAYLAAGFLGIRRKEELKLTDCDGWVSSMNMDERLSHNITTPLPSSLPESLRCLQQNTTDLHQCMGQDIIDRYIQIKRSQITKFGGLSEEQRSHILMQAY